MWRITIIQEYEYKLSDGTKCTSTQENEFMFCEFGKAVDFIDWAIGTGTRKTTAKIEYVEEDEE